MERKTHEITDQELMEALAEEYSSDDEERIELERGEDYVEVDGVKIIPFSLKQDLMEAKFDEKGNFVASSSTDSEYMDSEYEEEEEQHQEISEKMVALLKQLIALVDPYETVNEALSKCDSERLAEITDIATKLLFMGRGNIYVAKMKDLIAEIGN